MATTTRRQTPTQARKAAIESDYTPLYAAAGLTDLVAESIKNIVVTTQEKATKRITELSTRSTEQARLIDTRQIAPTSSTTRRRRSGFIVCGR